MDIYSKNIGGRMSIFKRLGLKKSLPISDELRQELLRRGYQVVDDPTLREDEVRVKAEPKPIILKDGEILIPEIPEGDVKE